LRFRLLLASADPPWLAKRATAGNPSYNLFDEIERLDAKTCAPAAIRVMSATP